MGGGLTVNHQNICYFNTTYRCLAHIPDFSRLLLDELNKLQGDKKNKYLNWFNAIKKVAVKWLANRESTISDEIFSGLGHQDGSEYLTFFSGK